jgi:hypothetical protein
MPNGHPERPSYLINLANALGLRFNQLDHSQDADTAISHLSTAATSPVGPPRARFNAAERWISIASLANHESLLDAYECAINIMPHVAWLGLPITERYDHLARIGGITRDAAATAISLERYDKALEWLEQGRSIVWTQILQLRTPVDHLKDVRPDLAERLVQISRLLDHIPKQEGSSDEKALSGEEEGRRYRTLVMEWESLIDLVRSTPGFEDFLRPSSTSHLMKAAQNGHIVVLNISKKRCDALALLSGHDEVIHIPLLNITSERIKELQGELNDLLYSNGARLRAERAAMRFKDKDDDDDGRHILAELWSGVVKPVVDSLALPVCFICL